TRRRRSARPTSTSTPPSWPASSSATSRRSCGPAGPCSTRWSGRPARAPPSAGCCPPRCRCSRAGGPWGWWASPRTSPTTSGGRAASTPRRRTRPRGRGAFPRAGECALGAPTPPFCRDLGRAEAEVVGKTDFDFYPPELAAKYRADDLVVLAEGRHVEQEEQT